MSEPTATPRRILHLVIEGYPEANRAELAAPVRGISDTTEIFPLTAENAREALKKIFAADHIAVWGRL